MIKSLIAVAVTSLFLSGCGGGNGNSNNPPTPPPVRTAPMWDAYFGVVETQIPNTVDHTNRVYPMDWGVWDKDRDAITERIVAQLKEAKANGFKEAIVAVGYLLFDSNYSYRGTYDLEKFQERLKSEGLYDMVVMLSIVDEPEAQHGLQEGALAQSVAESKIIWPVKYLVIYGDTKWYPAIQYFDVIAKDKYGLSAEGVFSEYPNINSTQQYALVAGGADPYRNDPEPFHQIMLRDARIAGLIIFMYGDYDRFLGVGKNGMLPQYKLVGGMIVGNR